MFVVTVPDVYTNHLVTKVMDTWQDCLKWARAHSVNGDMLIRDQQINKEFCTQNCHNPKLDWMYV